MPASTVHPYDVDPPRRPSLEDLGGDAFEDDAANPPDPVTMPNAAWARAGARSGAGLHRVTPLALVHVTFVAGAPTITALSAQRGTITAANITVTDNGAGDTSLTWATSLFPALLMPPLVSLADDIEIDRVRAYLFAGGVRVKTKLATVGTDCAFVVALL